MESLSDSSVKALLIYSGDDKLCRRVHYDILKDGLSHKDNISFMLVNGKGHNPNYTEDAVQLLAKFSKARGKLIKKKNLTEKEKKDA